MIIPYKIFGESDRLPFVTLGMRGPHKEAVVEAFVDSGADFSIFHAGWMDYLGLPRSKAVVKKIQVGDGDYIEALWIPVNVAFYGQNFQAPLTFSKSLGPDFNLLGRKGFFNRFKFCFDDKNFCLSVTPL